MLRTTKKILLSLLPLLFVCALLVSCDHGDDPAVTTQNEDAPAPWTPNALEPWNFTAEAEIPPSDKTCDYEFICSETVFDEPPATMEIVIKNRAGDGVYLSRIYIEKRYADIDGVNNEYIVPEFAEPGWVRIPFIMEGYWLEKTAENTVEGTIDLQKYLKAEYEYEWGPYRLVFPMNDAIHYVNFEIKYQRP